MDYGITVAELKAKYKKDELKRYNQIVLLDSIKLASMGNNDVEGYQIFTPEFIVTDMCKSIGDEIFDFSKTVLEPTSGDGAFTTYILNKRLEKALIGNNFEIESLKALSTIYSIEMDEELIVKQRSNIFTTIYLFVKKHKLSVPESYFNLTKCIILSNFMWAMFNADGQVDMGLLGTEVAYKMPEAEKGNFKPLDMPVWVINENEISVHYEGVEIW